MRQRQRRQRSRRQAPHSELLFALAFIGVTLIYLFYVQINVGDEQWLIISYIGLLSVVIISVVGVSIYRSQARHKLMRSLAIAQIDELSGIGFEVYIAEIFKYQGYKVIDTPKTGDFGVDLLVIKDDIKTAVQIKRYKAKVNQNAVREVVAGMALKRYSAHKSMVVTNSYFTKSVYELADAHQCELVDRDKLSMWILDFQTHKPTTMSSLDV